MTEYKCGHKSEPIFVASNNSNIYALHKVWMETTGFKGNHKECFNCFYKAITEEKENEK